MERKTIKVVVVLIPPPVEIGFAPINIKIMIRNLLAVVMVPIFTIVNPAVLEETDINKAKSKRRPFIKAVSVIIRPRVPTTMRIVFIMRTILAKVDNFDKTNFTLNNSTHTKKPIPPEMIKRMVTS